METKNSHTEVAKYTNDQLRKLVKELHEISVAQAPAVVKQSGRMKQLFALEKTGYNYWSDRYHAVSIAITSEIMYRILKDKF